MRKRLLLQARILKSHVLMPIIMRKVFICISENMAPKWEIGIEKD